MLRSPVANGMDVCGRARHTGRRGGERRHAWRRAIALISMPAPAGRAETWTVVRAGRCGPKRRAKTTFVSANSPRSVMNTVSATTPARELPASIRMASRLLNTSCGQLSQLPSHLLAFRARGRKILGLRLHRRAQGIALRFRPSLVHAHLMRDAVRGPHCDKGGVRFGQLGAKRSDIRGQLGGFRLDRGISGFLLSENLPGRAVRGAPARVFDLVARGAFI